MNPKLTLLLLLPLAACQSTIDVPEPAHTPRIALRYTLKSDPADTTFQQLASQQVLYVSNSQRIFDTRPLQGRADASVEIRDAGGAVVERFAPAPVRPGNYYGGNGYYRPTLGLVPRPGASYSLRAALPGFEAVESTLTFPSPPTVRAGSFTPLAGGPGPSGERQGRLLLTIPDDPNAANYYIAYAQALDATGTPLPYASVNVDYDSQASSAGIGQFKLSSPNQQYSIEPFSDAGANGQVLVLASDVKFYNYSCPDPRAPCPQPAFIEVTVSTLTADTYQFYLSRRRYYSADGSPFAEPAPLTSNLRNGYGIFAGSADTKYRIAL